MPYVGSLPKSGCSAVPPEPLISAMYAAERVETACFEMSVFHALSVGNTLHPPTVALVAPLPVPLPPAPQVAARVMSAAPMAKWESGIGTPVVSTKPGRVWSRHTLVSCAQRVDDDL